MMKQTIEFPCPHCKAVPGQLCPHMIDEKGQRVPGAVFHFERVIDSISIDMNSETALLS